MPHPRPVLETIDRLLALRRTYLAGPSALPLTDAGLVALAAVIESLRPNRVLVADAGLAAGLADLALGAPIGAFDEEAGDLPVLAVVSVADAGALARLRAFKQVVGFATGLGAGLTPPALTEIAAGGFIVLPVGGRALGLWRADAALLCSAGERDAAEAALEALALLFNDRSLDPLMLAERLQQTAATSIEHLQEELASLRRMAAEQQQALAHYRLRASK